MKRKLIVSILTIVIVLSQSVNTIALGADTSDDITAVTDEDAVAWTPDTYNWTPSSVYDNDDNSSSNKSQNVHTGSYISEEYPLGWMEYDGSSKIDIRLSNGRIVSYWERFYGTDKMSIEMRKGLYNIDKAYNYGQYTGSKYLTAIGTASLHTDLKNDLENYFRLKNLLWDGWSPSTFWGVYAGTSHINNPIHKALNSSKQQLELGDIAVENGLVSTNNTKASAIIPLATYFGIVNRDDGLLDYNNGTSAYLSRSEAALMIGRFMHPDSYMDSSSHEESKDQDWANDAYEILGKDSGYAPYLTYYDGQMMGGCLLLGSGKYGWTEKSLASNETRLEFIYTIIYRYFPDELRDTMIKAEKSGETSADYFKDINKKDIHVEASFYKDNKLLNKYGDDVDGASNKAFRLCLENKELLSKYDAAVVTAYKLGILTPDDNGNANLFKPVTMSQGLRFLVASAEATYLDD